MATVRNEQRGPGGGGQSDTELGKSRSWNAVDGNEERKKPRAWRSGADTKQVMEDVQSEEAGAGDRTRAGSGTVRGACTGHTRET